MSLYDSNLSHRNIESFPRIKTYFVGPEKPKARANKTEYYDFYFNIFGKLSIIRFYT